MTGTTADPTQPQVVTRPREQKLVYLWLPRQYVHARGADVRAFVSDINTKITERGFVNYDGQILRDPITDVTVKPGAIDVEQRIIPEIAGVWTVDERASTLGIAKIGERSELIFEGDDFYDSVEPRTWSESMAELFGISNPYQMCENAGDYTVSNICTVVDSPYLLPGELISALLHGALDNHYFYCDCHSAEVVYTTRHRLVCMGCGAMHLTLREPLSVSPTRLLSADDWFQHFDSNGELRHEQIDVAQVDFRAVENAGTLWTTDGWEDAKHRFVFFARSSPQEIEDAIRGTEMDPSIFLEAGWEPMEIEPPPAEQLAEDSVDVDLLENSAYAAREGVICFLRAQTKSSHLINAIPHLFRAVELLLKAKLERLGSRDLVDHPNNPTVLDRLAARGVVIAAAERSNVDQLRRLRNRLQHGSAKFNYRTGVGIARQALVFIDRFALQEMDSWLGDVVAPEDRLKLFQIKELAASARKLVAGRIEDARNICTAEITTCSTCGEHAVVRRHPSSGAVCYYCGHPPPLPEDELEP